MVYLKQVYLAETDPDGYMACRISSATMSKNIFIRRSIEKFIMIFNKRC